MQICMNDFRVLYIKRRSELMILLSLMTFVFVDWNGFGYYIFYLPLLYFITKWRIQIDSNFILLILFGFTYSFIDVINTGGISYVYNVLPIINFPFIYLIGKVIASNKTLYQQISILWIFAISMALFTILSIYESFLEEGFVLAGRDIELIGYSNENIEGLYSATGLYSKLLPLSLFVSFLFISIDKKSRLTYFAVACIVFVCCLRLQSRSAIYITSTALLIPLICGGKGRFINKILGVVFIVGVITYVLSYYSDSLLIIDRFENNNAFDNAGQESRADLMINNLNNLYSKPFGGLKMNRYAHNLWIDSARVSGWIPILFLILITFRWIKNTIQIYRYKKIDIAYRQFIVVVSVCLLMYFNTEPILEGATMLFSFFCLYFGMITKTLIDYKQK